MDDLIIKDVVGVKPGKTQKKPLNFGFIILKLEEEDSFQRLNWIIENKETLKRGEESSQSLLYKHN